MAGFFGLFDYTKEGKGVEKSERPKKGFFLFFEVFFRNLWNFIKIDAVYWLTSLLVITNGPAKAGLTYIARSTMRQKHSFLFSDYFDTVRKNLKQSLILGTINLLCTTLFILDIVYFWNSLAKEFTIFNVLGLALAFFLLVCTTFMKYYIWTLVITFKLSIKELIKNSFHFVFLNLWRNILIAAVCGFCYAVSYLLAVFNGLGMIFAVFFMVFVFPGFKAGIIQVNTFPIIQKLMIDPYYKEHKGEDIEKRRALGLDIPEDELPGPDEKSVFSDSDVTKENSM